MTTIAIDEHVISTYKRWPVEFVSGSGVSLYDASGGEYLDLVAGLAVTSVGHAHPTVVAAIAEQAARLIHVSNLYVTRPQQELAGRLAGLTGGMQSFFCNSGAEAIEAAIKLARKHTGKTRVVAFQGGFHGRTFGALSATGQPGKKEAFEPVVPGFEHVPYGDLGAVESALSDDVAAILVEPIQGEAGVVVPPEGFLTGLRALCDRTGVLLIADEVQTGIGRTGAWFAVDHSGVTPDIMCLAKGLGAGLPIGACLAIPNVASSFVAGDHATTFGGGPVQCAAALAVLDVIEDGGLIAHAARLGALMKDELGSIAEVSEVRGTGLLIAAELSAGASRDVAAAALERKVLVNDVGPTSIRLCPPLVITEEQARHGVSVLRWCIEEVCG